MKNKLLKKRILIIILLIGVSTGLISQTKSSVSNKEFHSVNKELKMENIKLTDILYKPEKILKSDNIVLIVDEGSEYYFSIYSYPDFKLLNKFGKKGKGPNEISFPPYVYYFDKEKIDFFDYQRNTIFELKIIGKENSLNVLQVLSPELIEIQNAIKITDTMVFGSGARKGKTFFYNTSTDLIRYYSYGYAEKIPKQHQHIICSGSIDVNYNSNKLVYASKYFDNYEAYDFYGSNILSVYVSDDEQVFFKNGYLTNQDTKMYYTTVFTTERYFYLLSYGGRSTKQLMELIERGNKNICEIQKYSWEGEPLESFIIDTPVKSFFVDENENTIYIVNPASEDFPIVKYVIK